MIAVVAHHEKFGAPLPHHTRMEQECATIKPSGTWFPIVPVREPEIWKIPDKPILTAPEIQNMCDALRAELLNVALAFDRAAESQAIIYEECLHRLANFLSRVPLAPLGVVPRIPPTRLEIIDSRQFLVFSL